MRRIDYPEEDIEQLTYYSIYHEHPIVRRRMLVNLLKSQGLPHGQIAEIVGISGTTLREHLDLYVAGGIDALKQLNYAGKPNELRARKDEIIAALEENPPATLKEAQAILVKEEN